MFIHETQVRGIALYHGHVSRRKRHDTFTTQRHDTFMYLTTLPSLQIMGARVIFVPNDDYCDQRGGGTGRSGVGL